MLAIHISHLVEVIVVWRLLQKGLFNS